MDNSELVEVIKSNFGGRDPLNELNELIKGMNVKELRKMIFISCNQIGTAVKQGEYDNPYDSALHLNLGADMLLTAYTTAIMSVSATTDEVGTA